MLLHLIFIKTQGSLFICARFALYMSYPFLGTPIPKAS